MSTNFLIIEDKKIEIDKPITIGSFDELSDLVYKGISPVHAKIYPEDEKVLIKDLISIGTFINGEKLEPHQPRILEDQDQIQIGNHQFVFNQKPEKEFFTEQEVKELNEKFNKLSTQEDLEEIIEIFNKKLVLCVEQKDSKDQNQIQEVKPKEIVIKEKIKDSEPEEKPFVLEDREVHIKEKPEIIETQVEENIPIKKERAIEKNVQEPKKEKQPDQFNIDERIIVLPDDEDELEKTELFSEEKAVNPKKNSRMTLKAVLEPYQEFEVNQFPFFIGSEEDQVDLVIYNDKIDRIHAAIEKVDDLYYVVDNRSSIGTLLNGKQVNRDFINHGDILSFDQVDFLVLIK